MQKRRAKIIIADVYDPVARAIMCESLRLGMTAKDGYVWFLPTWLTTGWWNTTLHNGNKENISCTEDEMLQVDKYLIHCNKLISIKICRLIVNNL